MAVKVIQGIVNNGVRQFRTGDIISGLSKADESRLVSLGVAELIPEEKKVHETNPYAGKTADELIAIIDVSESEDELKAIFEDEQKGKKRKTVFQAIEARMKAINGNDQTGHEDNEGNEGAGIGFDFNPDSLIKK